MIERFNAAKKNAKGLVLLSCIVNKYTTEEDDETHETVVTASWKELYQLIVMRDGSVIKQTVKNPALTYKEMGRKDSVETRQTVEFSELPERVQEIVVLKLEGAEVLVGTEKVDLGEGFIVEV